MLAVAEGTSTVTETVFENRFMHVEELVRMGAQIRVDGRTATVEGTAALHGAPVRALICAQVRRWCSRDSSPRARRAVGYIHHIDRGYDDLVAKLVALGADIERREAEWTE